MDFGGRSYGSLRSNAFSFHKEADMIVPPFDHDPLRQKPYVWVSWLTKLLAQEDKCWFKAWYKSRYKATKIPEDPSREDFFKEYNEKHDVITMRRADLLRRAGYTVTEEDPNSFKLRGQLADLAGKPDLVAIKGDTAIVSDSKSGRRRKSDHWQVLIYLFGLPLSWLKTKENYGEVAYKDGEEAVRALGPTEQAAIVDAIKKVSALIPPEAEPSLMECRYCDIAKCPVRFETPEGEVRDF